MTPVGFWGRRAGVPVVAPPGRPMGDSGLGHGLQQV